MLFGVIACVGCVLTACRLMWNNPNAPRPKLMGPLSPISIHGSPVTSPKFQVAPRLIFSICFGSEKKEPRYTCLSEANTLTEDMG
jgi:hypothetical protein